MTPRIGWHERLISAADQALRTLTVPTGPSRPSPARSLPDAELQEPDRQTSIALMRVNHAGEIAAQALYSGQSVFARSEDTRRRLDRAAGEEQDHLAWCAERLNELGGRHSRLDPLWYTGSFLIGLVAGAMGDRISLGFIAETEEQVEAHLHDHLQRLPQADARSAVILQTMARDEAHHGTTARLAGGLYLPAPVRSLMGIGGEFLRQIALRV